MVSKALLMKDNYKGAFWYPWDCFGTHESFRTRRLDELYEYIEKLGVQEAWIQYIIHDIEDVIQIEGPEFLMKHLDVPSKKKLIDYIKRHY